MPKLAEICETSKRRKERVAAMQSKERNAGECEDRKEASETSMFALLKNTNSRSKRGYSTHEMQTCLRKENNMKGVER